MKQEHEDVFKQIREDSKKSSKKQKGGALCLPCNPENTTGNILIPIIEVKTNFIEENAGKLYLNCNL